MRLLAALVMVVPVMVLMFSSRSILFVESTVAAVTMVAIVKLAIGISGVRLPLMVFIFAIVAAVAAVAAVIVATIAEAPLALLAVAAQFSVPVALAPVVVFSVPIAGRVTVLLVLSFLFRLLVAAMPVQVAMFVFRTLAVAVMPPVFLCCPGVVLSTVALNPAIVFAAGDDTARKVVVLAAAVPRLILETAGGLGTGLLCYLVFRIQRQAPGFLHIIMGFFRRYNGSLRVVKPVAVTAALANVHFDQAAFRRRSSLSHRLNYIPTLSYLITGIPSAFARP